MGGLIIVVLALIVPTFANEMYDFGGSESAPEYDPMAAPENLEDLYAEIGAEIPTMAMPENLEEMHDLGAHEHVSEDNMSMPEFYENLGANEMRPNESAITLPLMWKFADAICQGKEINTSLIEHIQNFSRETACEFQQNLTFSNFTLADVMEWGSSLSDNPNFVSAMINIQTGISLAVFNEFLELVKSDPHQFPPVVFTALVEGVINRSGKRIKQLTLRDISSVKSFFLHGVPTHMIRSLSTPVFDFMLETIYNASTATVNNRHEPGESQPPPTYQGEGQPPLSNSMNDSYQQGKAPSYDQGEGQPPSYDQGEGQPQSYDQGEGQPPSTYQGEGQPTPFNEMASVFSLAYMDRLKLKEICYEAFKRHRAVTTEEDFKKIVYLLPCAPAYACQNVDKKRVRDNLPILRYLPFMCSEMKGNVPEETQMIMPVFRDSRICGQFLMKKITAAPSMVDFNNPELNERLGSLILCASTRSLLTASQHVPCEKMDSPSETVPKPVADAIKKRCLVLPEDLSTIDCATLRSNLGYIEALPRSFWSTFSLEQMCSPVCLETLKNSGAKRIQQTVLNKCFLESSQTFDPSTASNLGGMVAELPVSLLDEVPAAQLLVSIKDIKASVKTSKRIRGQKRVALKSIALKMKQSGNLKNITDSKEMMKQVSLKDLKSSLTDVENDLGLDNPSLALTRAQKKWVMKKVLESKKPEELSAEEVRSKKGVITGFSSKDIKKIQRSNSSKIEMATALCEATDWPIKPLKAINRDLIKKELEVRDSGNPMEAFTALDVANIGCECLMHFTQSEIEAMPTEVCVATCTKIGSCDNFRCINPMARRNTAAACMKCMNLDAKTFTEADWDTLGLNLIAQLPASSLASIPPAVVVSRVYQINQLCMSNPKQRGLFRQLVAGLGSNVGSYTEDTIRHLSSSIRQFTVEQQRSLNKESIAFVAEQISSELSPNSDDKLQECCTQWLSDKDKEERKQQNKNLMITLKEAIIYEIRNQNQRRRKRSVVQWLCSHVRTLQEAFTTVTVEEIEAMDNEEFTTCLPDIGQLTWTDEKKSTLLGKAKSALSVTSTCDINTEDIISLGYIIQAASIDDIECLYPNQEMMASFGYMDGWSSDKLQALAGIHLQSTTNLATASALDMSTLGSILCGYNASIIGTLSPAVMAESGMLVGSLTGCSADTMAAFVAVATNDLAYGPVQNWTSAEVSELQHTIIGLSASQFESLSVTALEGLDANIIPGIPADVFSSLTQEQFDSLSDAQSASITEAQQFALPTEMGEAIVPLIPFEEEVPLPAGADAVQRELLTNLLLALSVALPLVNLIL